MNTYAIYAIKTGKIRQVVGGPLLEMMAMCEVDEALLEIDTTDCSGHFIAANALAPFPKSPGPGYEWNWEMREWMDQRSLDTLKEDKWAEVKKAREQKEFGGFVWDGSPFDSDPISQSRIQGAILGAILSAQMDLKYEQDWTLADNTRRLLNGTDVIGVGMALAGHISACHAHGREVRAQIQEAKEASDVKAAVWAPEGKSPLT